MCGIAGIIVNNSKQYKTKIDFMLGSLHHRGPDGKGDFYFNNCALGHVRLSIIDHALGAQPMLNNKENIGIVFNGEIYGYQALREEFKFEYQFKTSSDTEIILAFYEKYQEKMLNKLPGMFSFAIWDDKQQKLFAARDRFGEKPFYYAWGENGEFIFASEIKAILATNLVKPILSKESIIHYLRHLYVAPNRTIYENIFVLPPAHCLVLTLDRKISIFKYWNFPDINYSISFNEAIEKFKILLENAVKKQLIADVPVGAFLSGGLDSSTIVALASRYNNRLNTFSFGFGNDINELPMARLVAKKYFTNHTELQISEYSLINLIIKMNDIYDEPFADSSNIPTYLISKEASKKIKTILTGDGADELLGGYISWYKPLLYMNENFSFKEIIFLLINIQKNKWREIYYYWQGRINRLKYNNIMKAHSIKNTYFSDQELKTILKKEVFPEQISDGKNLNDIMRFDASVYMPGDILVKTDRASMANGLELRAPFLDVDFAEFCLSLPFEFKINSLKDKIILREAMSQLWPSKIKYRNKQGFGAPINKWLEDYEVIILKKEILENKKSKIYEIFDFNSIQFFLNKKNYQEWSLLILALWFEKNNKVILK